MQTRSMTKRAGEPHDLEAFNSYAEADFEFDLPVKKRQRFLNWDEDSDDSSFIPSDGEEDSDDEEDSFEAATGSSESDFDPYEPPQMPTYDEVPEEIKAAYDPNHFCPSWVKCCEENLAKSLNPPPPSPPARAEVQAREAEAARRHREVQAIPAANRVLGPRQYASGSAEASNIPVIGPADWSNHVDTMPAAAPLPPVPRWPEELPTWRARFTRTEWRDYIGEICHHLSYEDRDGWDLTQEEYEDAHLFMHGKF